MSFVSRGVNWALLVVGVLIAVGCGPADESPRHADIRADTPRDGVRSPVVASRGHRPRIVVLGDSLTAGLGLPVDRSYPALLQQRLDREGLAYEVVNAGVSGDTSAGGLRRLDWALQGGNVAVLVVELGANDGLRGLPVSQMKQNLRTIIRVGKARGARVLLAGMEAPPNVGAIYTAEFRQVYRELAREEGVDLLPFLLAGVAGVPSLNQPDGIHPNEAGARSVEQHVWTALQKLLGREPAK